MKIVPIAILALAGIVCVAKTRSAGAQQTNLGHRSVTLLTVDGLQFKDLNKDGKLEPYEDWRLSPEVRAKDLLERMTLEEMAGTMVHGTAFTTNALGISTPDGSGYNESKIKEFVQEAHITSFITRLSGAPSFIAAQNNRIQEVAEAAKLGIPVTISSDPRNQLAFMLGASTQAGGFSKWPDAIGFGALGDEETTRRFADVVRQEYMAVGIREALSPQADVATEPRWGRIGGTFGEDAEADKKQVKAYVEGMQAGSNGPNTQSVLAVVKHWVGYGAAENGLESHSYVGRFATFPGGNFDYHVIPFRGAFEVSVAAVMPTYSILKGASIDGTPLEQVGAGFNKQLLQGLLRDKEHFTGVVLSDWEITGDCNEACMKGAMPVMGAPGQVPAIQKQGKPWGVENMSTEDRFAKAINAGMDQLGGTEESDKIVAAVHDGKISMDRIRESTYRILLQKFEIGLFEDPYVDPARADTVVGNAEFVKEGVDAQKRSMVLLENKGKLLPLAPAGKKIFLSGIDPAVASQYGFVVVDGPEKADVAIIKTAMPGQGRPGGMMMGRETRLDFNDTDPGYAALVNMSAKVPTIVVVNLNQPVILTNVKDKAAAILGDFGVEDAALLDVLSGKAHPEGHLPFEFPSSMEAVREQKSDLPHDSKNPLYPYGYGLQY